MPTSSREASTKRSHSIRRWNSKSATKMSSPLIDRTNTQKSAYSTTTAATATSSFLPELYSTPPMPTFQKPDMPTQTPVRKGAVAQEENATPTRSSGYVPRKPHANPQNQAQGLAPVQDTDSPLRIPDRTTSAAIRPVVTISQQDRIGETPPLPRSWTAKHDRAICVLDARNYSLTASIAKMRRTFPELRGTLTPAMVDKRLRQLDQDVEIDYWRIGLRREEEGRSPEGKGEASAAAERGGPVLGLRVG